MKLHSAANSKLPALISRRCLPRSCQPRLNAPALVGGHERVEHQHGQAVACERARLCTAQPTGTGGIEIRRVQRSGSSPHSDVQPSSVLRTRFRSCRQSSDHHTTEYKQPPIEKLHKSLFLDFSLLQLPFRPSLRSTTP